MSDKDVPEWLKEADSAAGTTTSGGAKKEPDWNFDLEVDGTRRKRKEVSYRDQFTDSEFVKMCEDGVEEDDEPDTKRVKDATTKAKKAPVVPKVAASPPSGKRRRESSAAALSGDEEDGDLFNEELPDDDDSRRERKVLCYFYRKIYDGVLKLTDATGRFRCELYMEKPSAEDYPDYYDFVKVPMDLYTIKTRIDRHLYMSHSQFEDDFKLMVSNAHTYNHPQSLVYHDANEIDKFVKSKMKRVKQKTLPQLAEEYEVARQQHKVRSKARKEKKRSRPD